MASKVGSIIVHEVRQMLPPTVYFFVCLNVLVLTIALLSDRHEVRFVSHAAATVGALLVGKAVLLADMLPFFERHSARPLIYPTLWKSFLYFAAAFVLHLTERLVGAALGQGGMIAGAESEMRQIDWAHFASVQIWLAILILVYVAVRESVRAVGTDRVHRMFFVDPRPNEP